MTLRSFPGRAAVKCREPAWNVRQIRVTCSAIPHSHVLIPKEDYRMASMGTGGRSGTSDAERSHRLDQDTGALPRDMATDALGEPVGVVNMRTFETTEPTPAGTTSLEQP